METAATIAIVAIGVLVCVLATAWMNMVQARRARMPLGPLGPSEPENPPKPGTREFAMRSGSCLECVELFSCGRPHAAKPKRMECWYWCPHGEQRHCPFDKLDRYDALQALHPANTDPAYGSD